MKRQLLISSLFISTLCLVGGVLFSCTNVQNANMSAIGEYIEKEYGSQSTEYREYSALWNQLRDNQQWSVEQSQKYGDQSIEFYQALQEVINSQNLLLDYFNKIGAAQASKEMRTFMPAFENRATELEKRIREQEKAKEGFLHSIAGTYLSEPTNYMGEYIRFRIILSKNKSYVMEIIDNYNRVRSIQSGKFSPVADKNGCVLNPNTSNSSWIDVLNTSHIQYGNIDLYK